MEFLGDGRAADLVAALEHEGLESGFGEVKRGDQAIVPAANNDDVARVRHALCSVAFLL